MMKSFNPRNVEVNYLQIEENYFPTDYFGTENNQKKTHNLKILKKETMAKNKQDRHENIKIGEDMRN